MKKITSTIVKLWKDESGQGTAEYVLITMAIVGLAIAFRSQIQTAMQGKLKDLGGKIGSFGSTT